MDQTAVRWLFLTLTAWLHQREADAIAYLLEENRILRAQIGRRPLRIVKSTEQQIKLDTDFVKGFDVMFDTFYRDRIGGCPSRC